MIGRLPHARRSIIQNIMWFLINNKTVEDTGNQMAQFGRQRWKRRLQLECTAPSRTHANNANAHSPLLTLPDELLTIIVEKCLEPRVLPGIGILTLQPGEKCSTFRQLRQIHRRFNNLRFINCDLFSKIRFYVEPGEMRDLGESLAWMGPYVRRIRLEHNSAWADSKLVDVEHLDEVKETATQINTALEDGTMRATLINLVRKMPNLDRICLDTPREIEKEPDDEPKSRYDRYDDPYCRDDKYWNRDLGPFNDTILSLGLSCIAATNIRLIELSFVLTTNQDLCWTALPGWHTMDFSKLEKLSVGITFHNHRLCQLQFDPAHARRFMQQAIPAIVDLTKRSASTLQELSISYEDFIFGHPMESTPPMPHLSSLKLYRTTLDTHSFDKWLSKCPNLALLRLERVSTRTGHGFPQWRPLFDAIKKHSRRNPRRRLHIEYDIMLRWHDNHSLSFDHTVPDAAYEYDGGWWGDQPEQGDIVEMLSNYVSGLGMWNVDPQWRAWAHYFGT